MKPEIVLADWVDGMSEVRGLLEKSGYSGKAIEYYLEKLNVGRIDNQGVYVAYTDHAATL